MLTSYKKPFLPLIQLIGTIIESVKLKDPPIIIGGCGRSGTTILLSILSAHKEILACPKELNLFNSNPKRIDRLYTFLLKNGIPRKARRWCEKTPRSVRHIKEIDQHFKGKFKYIHIVRDGRDVILSNHPKAPGRYWIEPERWVRDVSAGLEFEHHPSVLLIKYESLILNYDETITTVCEFLDLPVSPEIMNWHNYATVKRNEAYYGKVEKISAASIGKWQDASNTKRVNDLLQIPEALHLLKKLDYL
jgi:hypothetical protein